MWYLANEYFCTCGLNIFCALTISRRGQHLVDTRSAFTNFKFLFVTAHDKLPQHFRSASTMQCRSGNAGKLKMSACFAMFSTSSKKTTFIGESCWDLAERRILWRRPRVFVKWNYAIYCHDLTLDCLDTLHKQTVVIRTCVCAVCKKISGAPNVCNLNSIS